MAAGDIALGAFNLNDATNYGVTVANPPAAPVDLMRHALAIRPGSAISYVRYPENLITIRGYVKGTTTFADTEDKLDALMAALYLDGDQNLTLGFQDERYWRVRLMEASVEKLNPVLYEYQARFLAADPFAHGPLTTVTDTLSLVLVSGSTYSGLLDWGAAVIGGSILSRPFISVTVPAATSYGISELTVRNQTTGPPLTIAASLVADDEIEIDAGLSAVRLNGVDVFYFGTYLMLDPRLGATNALEFRTVATSAPTLDVSMTWRPRYA